MQEGNTALMLAAREGHVACLRLIVETRADKDFRDIVRQVVLALL